jgi:hypothetical protein
MLVAPASPQLGAAPQHDPLFAQVRKVNSSLKVSSGASSTPSPAVLAMRPPCSTIRLSITARRVAKGAMSRPRPGSRGVSTLRSQAQAVRRRTKDSIADPSEAQANAKAPAKTNPLAVTGSGLMNCCVRCAERASGSSDLAASGAAVTAAVVSGSFITVADPVRRGG